jgi:sugar/nucleoside kinase (ribokinase family)
LITIIGDAFVDIAVPADDILLGGTYYRNIKVSYGGLANTAIEIARLGESVSFVGKIGDDIYGMFFKENLKKNGVVDLSFTGEKQATGLCVSMWSGSGERSMVANRGANDYLTVDEIESRMSKISRSKVIYCSGYSLLGTDSYRSILYVMQACRKLGCKICFNPGAPNIITAAFKDIIAAFVDILILNAAEARQLTEAVETNEVLAILDMMNIFAIITNDKKGCVFAEAKKQIWVPLDEPINIIDTTGAGDAFAAGFIVARLRGQDNLECAKMGQKVATEFLRRKCEATPYSIY